MILPTMSYEEMFKSLETDINKVQIRITKIKPKVIKLFGKAYSFPMSHIDEYRIPATNNLHIIYYYAANATEAKNPHITSFSIVFSDHQRFVLRATRMGYKHTHKSNMVMLPQIHVYTSHFLQRYNERFLHKPDITVNDIAGLFLVRNPTIMPIRNNEEINRNYDRHGSHNEIAIRVRDGFCFTQTAIEGKDSEDGIKENDIVNAMVIIYTTFINENEMTAEQKTAINKEHLETLRQCFEQMRNLNNL